jgi:hypothetical protein
MNKLMSYRLTLKALENDLSNAAPSLVTTLASRLITSAQQFDLNKTAYLGVNAKIANVIRNASSPQNYTDDKILGAPWADNETAPLDKGEVWHKGRRATNTGLKYAFDAAGLPINPYMNTGLQGRGVLGQFGPNHAVDNGILRLKADENGAMELYALGILRKYDNDAPAFSGGFAKYKRAANGAYIFDRDAVIETQVEELFEEMISGSITLQSPYSEQLKPAIQAEYDLRMQGRNGLALTTDQKSEIDAQIETGLKMQQVADLDPDFLKRLHDVVAKGHECYAGPIMNDNRNTNNAWIETRLSWFLISDQQWNAIKGPQPLFPYAFSAGDDASGVVEHKITPRLIEDAYASHGALFAFMAASYVLNMQDTAQKIEPSVLTQLEAVAAYLEQSVAAQPKNTQPPKLNSPSN